MLAVVKSINYLHQTPKSNTRYTLTSMSVTRACSSLSCISCTLASTLVIQYEQAIALVDLTKHINFHPRCRRHRRSCRVQNKASLITCSVSWATYHVLFRRRMACSVRCKALPMKSTLTQHTMTSCRSIKWRMDTIV